MSSGQSSRTLLKLKVSNEEKNKKSKKQTKKLASPEEGPWKRTIKATVADIRKEKDFYILYFEDEDIGLGDFEEETMLLDGLHKWLYVTFKDEKTAMKAIDMKHDPDDSNITNVELATSRDFDTYPNLLFLYGYDDICELKDLISNETGLEVEDIDVHDEPKAVVIIFGNCLDITQLTWELKKLNGTEMITAPVYKENSILIFGLNNSVPEAQLLRYMKNKKRSGGGEIQSLTYLSEEEAVLTFVNETDLLDVLKLKGQHAIGGTKLEVSNIYPCLTKNYLTKFISDVSPKHLKHSISSAANTLAQKNLSHSQSEKVGIETSFDITESLGLKDEELHLLEKSNFLSDLRESIKSVKVIFDHDNADVIIKGNDKSEIFDVQIKILNICRNDIAEISVNHLAPEQQQFLRNKEVLLKLNSMLTNAYLMCSGPGFKIMYIKSSEDSKKLLGLVDSQIFMHRKSLTSDMVNILQSRKGQTFLSELGVGSNDGDGSPKIELDTGNKSLFIIGPNERVVILQKDIEIFLELNQVFIKEIPFSQGKLQFMKQYMQQEFDSIQLKSGSDVDVQHVSNKFIIKGLKDPVEECFRSLTHLSTTILNDELKLEYFGIQEFLQDEKGSRMLEDVQEKNNCLIIAGSEDSYDLNLPQSVISGSSNLIAKAKIDGAVTLSFIQGSLLDVKVDVIVNPLESSLKLTSSLSKAIIKQGGSTISADLNFSKSYNNLIFKTTSGNLSDVQSILHVKCPVYNESDTTKFRELRESVRSCLEFADNNGCNSIGFPAVGCDKTLKFPPLAACNYLVRDIVDFAESKRKSLRHIYLCDNKEEVVNELIERFEAVSTNHKIEKFTVKNKKGSRQADVQQIKKLIFEAIKRFSKRRNLTVELIKLVIFDQKTFDIFTEEESSGCGASSSDQQEKYAEKDISEEHILTIYSKNSRDIKVAIDFIEKFCKKYYKEFIERDDRFAKKLSIDHIKELKQFGLQKRIKVTNQADTGFFKMEGFSGDDIFQVEKKMQRLILEIIDKHNNALHKSVQSATIWQYKKGEKWYTFEPIINSELEHKYQQEENDYEFTDENGDKMEIDFRKLKAYLIDENDQEADQYDIKRQDLTKAVDLVMSRGDKVIFSDIPLKVSPLYDETDASPEAITEISEMSLSSGIKSESNSSLQNVSREVEFIPRSLPKKTNKLIVRGIPDGVTKDHLNIFFKNQKRLGGGPVEEIVFLEDKTSAVIIFKENEAVDLVMSRGETVIFSSSPLNVSPFYDETDDSCEAKTEIIEMPLSSGIKSESNNSAENGSTGAKWIPINQPMNTNKLKVRGIPEHMSISKDQLSLLFKNKRGQGGGPVEAINLTEDGTSAVVIFKESEAVDLVMSRGSTVTISKVSLEVSPLYDETDDSTCNNSEMSEIKLSSKTNSKSKHSSENVSSGDKLKPSSSSKKTNKLKVTGLPDKVTKDQLNIFFKNKRGQGGGHIEAIHIPKDGTNAIVIFKETEAVDLIMSRGNTVTYLNATLTVKPYYKEITTETPEAQDNIIEDSEMHRSIKQKKKKPKVENRKMSTNMVTSDSEGSCKLTEKEKEKPLSFKKMEKEKSKKGETPPTKENDKDKQEDNSEFAFHNTTVKIKLHSLDTCKDTYIYYLEDETLNIGPFHEESLMLDGLHNNIYVTFHTQKDAKSFCQKKHPPDMKISKVEMATEEDFKTYPNYIFLKGNLENLVALAEQINEKTGLEVSDIIQEDDLDACIVKFDPHVCDDITELTWTLTSVGGNKMITAPVYKNNCVSVSGLTPDVSIPTLKRYLENKKRSGGGKTKSLVQIAEDEVVVYFENDVDLTALLSKEDHAIEHTDLIISCYYPCLSRNYVKKDDSLKVKPEKNQPLPSKTFSKKKQLQVTPGSLMSAHTVKKQGPIFVGMLTLTPYAFPYLKEQKHKLENIAQEAYCEMTLFPQMLQLKLKWPLKIEAKEVKQKLENGCKEISNYLNQLAVLTFTMNESEAQHFQHFCTGKVDILYHEESSKMIVIRLDTQTSLKALIHHLYDEFIQQGKDQQDSSRLIEIKKKLSLSEGAEKINVWTDISKAKSELKVSVEEKTFQHHEEVSLDKFEIKLLEKCLFFDQFKETYKETKINLDYDTNKLILMGNDKSQLDAIHFEILNKCRQDVGFSKLESVTADQMKLLKKDNVQKKVDSMLDNCYMQCNENDVKLYYLKSGSVNISDAEKKIRSQVEVTKKIINQDMLKILESSDGSTFLSSLTDHNSSFNTVIQLDSNNQELLIICPGDQIYQLNKTVDNYLETNKLHQKEISLSYGKQQFINKYLMEELNHLKSSLGRDATLEFLSDKCLIKGLRDPVSNCEVHINKLVSKIDKNDVQLNFFGIDEFLHDSEGKSLLRDIEETHRCVIQFKSEAKKAPAPKVAIKPPTLIAKCSLRDVNISFFQGNIFGLKADAVVNPLDSSFQFVSAINRELIQQGGLEIQREFEKSNTSSSVGSVVETSSGSLSKVKNIIHAVCPVYLDHQQVKELELTVKACLHHAAAKNYSTISLPTVGLGKILKFPLLPACKILLESIKSSLESGRHSFKDIFLCDVNSDNIKEIMDMFEAQGIEIEHFNKPTDKKEPTKSHSRSPPKSFAKKSWDFKNMKVDIVLGEINKQDTDIIVITVDKSLDLSKGRLAKTILREAGDDIQNELLNRFSDGVRTGDFAESSGGNLQCKHIFHACLSRFRGDTVQMEHLVLKLLEGANRLKAKSISIPALGTGNLGYAPENSADVIMKTIENFAAQNPHFNLKINIVVFPRDTDVAQAFKAARESFATGGQSDIEEEASSASFFGSFKKLASYFSKAPTDNKGIQKYGNVSLKIKQGDITKERNCDVIVNGIKDSMDLSHSGQVCKTLLKICGQELQDECSRKIDEMKTNGLVVTSAPKLQCKNIIHISQDQFSKCLDKGVTKILLEAEKIGASTLSLPVLGAGSRHANHHSIKKSILGAIEQFGNSGAKKLTKIKLVIFDPHVFNIFMGHGEAKVHSSHDKSIANMPPISVSQKAELVIYSDNAKERMLAEKELKKNCKSAFKEEKDTEQNLTKLSNAQIKSLEYLGLQNRIKVTVRAQEHLVIMEGFQTAGMFQVHKQLKKLVVEAVDKHHMSLLHAVPSSIEWQYKQREKWRSFDSVLNSETEREFKNKSDTFETTDMKGRKISINFQKMKETFQEEQGGKQSFDIRRYDKTRSGSEPLPKKWDKMSKGENLKMVQVQPSSEEYTKVQQHFASKGANFPIKKMERIQNKALYQQFSVKKRDINLNNPKGHQNELKLFHGTAAQTIPFINENGFDRSHCGVNGTAYGKGVYFALNSSYSVGYAKPDTVGNRYMYVARVLVGENITTNGQTQFLPNKPGTNRPYDSGGNPSNGIYVIFHDAQVYPEYLITF